MKNVKPRFLMFIAVIALALLATAVFYARRPPAPVKVPVGNRVGAAAAATTWFGTRPPAYGVFASVKNHSLSERIDGLMASGRPEDAFDAYGLVADCLVFQQVGFLHVVVDIPGQPDGGMSDDDEREETRLCSGLTEPIKAARLAHLAIAANAGVRGSDVAFLEAGPFGDPSALTSRPGDPLVVAWKQQALALLTKKAEQGDMGSLTTLSNAQLAGSDAIDQDHAAALAYALVMRKIWDDRGIFGEQGKFKGAPYPYDDDHLALYKAGLSDSEVAAAAAQAALIKARYDGNIGKNR